MISIKEISAQIQQYIFYLYKKFENSILLVTENTVKKWSMFKVKW